MRILQISTELVPSGAEIIVFELSRYLKLQGHDVSVACVKAVRGDVGNWLKELNIDVFYVDLNYRKPWGFLKIISFIKYVKNQKFDLIHAHQFHANVLARLTRLLGGAKVISTVHLVERRFRPWHFWFDSLTAPLCQKEICVSQAVFNYTKLKAPRMKDKLCVIYNGINFEKHALEPFLLPNLLKDKFVFGAVGRLAEQKGFIYLLEAFRQLKQKHGNIGLIIVGEGTLRVSFEKFIQKYQLQDSVVLNGYSSNTVGFYRTIQALVMPSLFEGFGLVAVEAMAAAVPVIASHVDSLPEIIEDQVNGYLCPPKDISALAEQMEALMTDYSRAQAVGLVGQKSVKERFSIYQMLEEHLKLYQATL